MDKTSGLMLNREQLDAIKFGSGPLLIIAGAGTGKTTVITERIKYLILSKKVKPSEILALTFTEKAAREMEERVDVAMPLGFTQMWIMTFHSFCDRILRREALHIGLDPRYKLMTEAEGVQLLRNNIFKLELNYFRPLGNPTKFLSGMLQHFSRLQDEDVSPQDYQKWVKGQMSSYAKASEDKKLELDKWSELSKAYRDYDELKVKNALLDFGDLIVKTLKLFRSRPNILKEYQKQFKHLLVDEFQDTNYAQNELTKLLAGSEKNITVVGDDDQSIYRFRGAAVSNIIQFRKNFPKTKVVVLTKNYRSTQEILDRSYDLIQFNNPDRLEVVEKVDKKLKSQVAKDGAEISFIHSDRVENESDEIAKTIKKIMEDPPSREASEGRGKYSYKDFAILVRANNHSESIMRALSRHGVPYQFLGPGRLFKQPEIVDLISYLKVLYNFTDSVSFYRLASIDHFGITGRELAELGNYARKNNVSLFESAEKIGSETIQKLLGIIGKHLNLVKKETAGQLLYYFLEETGLLQKLLSPESVEAENRAKNISKFFDKLKTYEVDHEDATVTAVVDWLDLSMELGESPLAANEDWMDINAVNILTVHSAKGLEFPVVFIVNLVGQRFPTTERREQIPIPDSLIKEILPVGDYHLEEERRLFYVGMTRAKEKLILTAADYYGEGKREKKLSPFIFEALGDRAVSAEKTAVKVDQLSFLDYKTKTKSAEASAKVDEALHIDYLSYSQIETFQTCPLHYKLRYIYKVPTPTSASQSFGTAMHATLKEFYETFASDPTSYKTSRGLEVLMTKLLEKNWVKEGYTSKKHEHDFFEKGKVYLSGFLKNGFNPKILPVALEQPFTVPIGKDLKIGGRVDRVDDLGNGEIEIVDYKTGANLPLQKDVDKNLQLSFYALGATKIPTTPFGKTPDKIKLSLYYLDEQEKISTTRTAKQLEEAVNEIIKVRDEIEKSDFKCSGHMFCQTGCEFFLFCKSED
ncbi:MAG: ATP-dependent DNA helicase [Candidatus Woesebacteria bacterium]|nr:ATP-dependent DNA helicase [Candidatus Woesebacteria bacterium]